MVLTIYRPILFAVVLSISWLTTAHAHHSTSRFDMANPITVTGTVKEFRWGNPHTWLYLVVPNDKGGTDVWEFEGPAVAMLARNGWKNTTLQPGNKIDVIAAPLRDGSPGGTYMRITRDNGEVLSTGRL